MFPRKHRQVLGVDLNRAESSCRGPAHERFDAVAGDGAVDGAIAERGSPTRPPRHTPAANGLAFLKPPRRNPFTDARASRSLSSQRACILPFAVVAPPIRE